MQSITTVGLDIAKSVFQVHGVDADGQVVMRRQLKRRYVLAFLVKGHSSARESYPLAIISCQRSGSQNCWIEEK
jgi:transposase